VVSLTSCDSKSDGRADPPKSVLVLRVDVRDSAGERWAEIDCGTSPRAAGYITPGKTLAAACQTALANDYADEFLFEGRFPAQLLDSCAGLPDSDPLAGTTVLFSGTHSGERFRESLSITDTCKRALTEFLLPLITPRQKGVVVQGNVIQMSDE
jgi:hypothetical protein